MRQVIVTTTINQPTEAIKKFDEMPDWQLLVIGDKKTPYDYKLTHGIYVSPDEQEKYDKALSDAIGWNCIQRRNFGLLMAYDMGADVIAVIDDDNIPLEHWGTNLLVGRTVELNMYDVQAPAFDPLAVTNYPHIWHRGFPLQLLRTRKYAPPSRRSVSVHVQADLWNGDPDIDAICRMEHAPECSFSATPFPFSANRLAPFNSQNTFLTRDMVRDYFLFPFIGRMDDIWAAFHVQAKGWSVAFGAPSVYQDRNVHDATKDMKAEYLGYEHNIDIVSRIPGSPERIFEYLPDKSILAFQIYQRHFH